jgi:6-phosphogluconolactonase
MKIEVFADADSVARKAAAIISAEARANVAAHGRFIVAFSGGHTQWLMLRALADKTVRWAGVHVAQVDERVAPAGDPDRNLTHLRASLFEHAPLRPEQICAMFVESLDLEAAAKSYAVTLTEIAGSPPVFDLVQLGLGPDGHTGSLVPGDPVLQVTDTVTGIYQGRRRMTLTYRFSTVPGAYYGYDRSPITWMSPSGRQQRLRGGFPGSRLPHSKDQYRDTGRYA